MDSIVRSEFHSYHVTSERDMGVLESGIYKGCRFIAQRTGVGESWEAAELSLKQGGSIHGYRIEVPAAPVEES